MAKDPKSLDLGPQLATGSGMWAAHIPPEWVIDPPFILRYLDDRLQLDAIKIHLQAQVAIQDVKTQQLKQMVNLVDRAAKAHKG